MFHCGPVRWVLVRLLGAEDGKPPHYYRDPVLGFLFLVGALIAIVLAFELKFSKTFWTAAVAAAVCLFLATERKALIGGLLAFFAIRCVVGATRYRQPILLLGAAAAAAGLIFATLVKWEMDGDESTWMKRWRK